LVQLHTTVYDIAHNVKQRGMRRLWKECASVTIWQRRALNYW
jgi:hypothetical protein